MREFQIHEISAVDNPAQVHAKAVLLKRHEDDPALERQEVLEKIMSEIIPAEAELDRLAQEESVAKRISYAKAYNELLDTPRGRALYATADRAHRDPSYVEKFAKAQESALAAATPRQKPAVQAIEAAARELHKFAPAGQTFAKTYNQFLDTPQGRKLYALA
jgi:hypothetical protein